MHLQLILIFNEMTVIVFDFMVALIHFLLLRLCNFSKDFLFHSQFRVFKVQDREEAPMVQPLMDGATAAVAHGSVRSHVARQDALEGVRFHSPSWNSVH